MSIIVIDGGWIVYFGIFMILYGLGSLEEVYSVDEKIKVKELV